MPRNNHHRQRKYRLTHEKLKTFLTMHRKLINPNTPPDKPTQRQKSNHEYHQKNTKTTGITLSHSLQHSKTNTEENNKKSTRITYIRLPSQLLQGAATSRWTNPENNINSFWIQISTAGTPPIHPHPIDPSKNDENAPSGSNRPK